MDPLSICASVLAVSGAAGTASKAANSFYKMARKAGKAGEDMKFFSAHIDAFASIIHSAYSTIRDHYSEDNKSRTLEQLNQKATLTGLVFQVKHIIKGVKTLEPQLRPHTTGLSLKESFLWVWKGSEREELCVWMERVQLQFFMVMLQITYEALQQKASLQNSLQPEGFDFKRDL
jgi:hypothetical protein